MVYVGGLFGNLFIDKPEEVRKFTLAFDHLRAAALDLSESADFIARTAHDM